MPDLKPDRPGDISPFGQKIIKLLKTGEFALVKIVFDPGQILITAARIHGDTAGDLLTDAA